MQDTKQSNETPDVLKVKEVADYLGISPKTVKKLEQIDVFPKPRRNHWNFRVYDRTDLPDYKERLREYQENVRNRTVVASER